MSEPEFLKEVNDALRLPPSIGTAPSTTAAAPSPSFSSPFSAMLPTGGGGGDRGGGGTSGNSGGGGGGGAAEGFPGILSGFSALAALPLAAASTVGEGFAKGAEGVAGALAGLSLGLQGGEAGGAGAGAGFCTPPEAVEVRETGRGGGFFVSHAGGGVCRSCVLFSDVFVRLSVRRLRETIDTDAEIVCFSSPERAMRVVLDLPSPSPSSFFIAAAVGGAEQPMD